MKNLVYVILLSIILSACNQSAKVQPVSKPITFVGLDSINGKSKDEIENYLKSRNFKFLNSQKASDQWQSKSDEEIIQFNGNGVLVFLTYEKSKYDSMVAELINDKYKSIGIDIKNGMEVETYTKENKMTFLSSIDNPENNRKTYSLTLIN